MIKYTSALVLALTLTASGSAQVVLEQWMFTETASRHLGGVTNTGTVGSTWNSGSSNKAFTNYPGNALEVASDPNGTSNWARNTIAVGTPYTTGKYLLELDLDSWNLTGHETGDTGATLSANTTHKIELTVTDGGSEVAGIKFRIQDTSAGGFTGVADKTSIHFSGGASDSFTSNLGMSSVTGSTYAVEFDFDNNTINYLTDSTIVGSEVFSAAQFDRIDFKVTSSGTNSVNWVTGGVAGGETLIDSIRLTAVPEPSTFALFAGLIGLISVMLRRRE